MNISLTNHNEFESFQDLAYFAFKAIEARQVSFLLSIFEAKDTDEVLSSSWMKQIEKIVGPIKANKKATYLVYHLKGIVITTNYYLSLYQKEHNIDTLLSYGQFKPEHIRFPVRFSPTDETVVIDLPEDYSHSLGEAYRLFMAIEKGDYEAFVSFLDEYGATPYDKGYLRVCFQHLEEFPRGIDKDKPHYLALYEKLFLE